MNNNLQGADEKNQSVNNIDNIPTPNAPKSNDQNITIKITDNNEVKPEQNPQVQAPSPQVDAGNVAPVQEQKVEVPMQQAPQAQAPIQNQSQTIGTIQQDKQKSPIAILILFIVLVIFIVFMPYIIEFTNKVLGTDLNAHDGEMQEETKKTEETPEQTNTSTVQDLSSSTVIKLGNIEFSGFNKAANNTLSLNIKNTATGSYKFDKKVYLDLYNSGNVLIGRAYLESLKDISGGSSRSYDAVLTNDVYNNASKVSIVLRTEDDYPAITLNDGRLTCKSQNDELSYVFDENNKLVNVKDTYTYIKGNDTQKYNDEYASYKSRIESLDKNEGVTAVITQDDTGFVATVIINYKNADYSNISTNTNYYMKDSEARIVNFEMNAKGYICE